MYNVHRIVELSGRCNDILLSSAKNKIGYYLQQALDELNVYLETACNKYQGEGETVAASSAISYVPSTLHVLLLPTSSAMI